MALGSGTFVSQNQALPGAYINFIAASSADAKLSERGVVAMLLPLQWNVGELVRVTAEELAERAYVLFGTSADSKELRPVREALCEAQEVLVYVPGVNGGASCTIGRARRNGYWGSKIVVKVTYDARWNPIDEILNYETYFDGKLVDRQMGVGGSSGKVLQDNDFVVFKESAKTASEGTYTFFYGNEISPEVSHYQLGLDALEREQFHVLAYDGTDAAVQALIVNYTKRMREECGVKFQTVLYNNAANYEGIVNVTGDSKLVDWVAGAMAGCEINESLTNKTYSGELLPKVDYTQSELTLAAKAGEFVFHTVGGTARVLLDQNSNTEDAVLASNQTVRILDQIANDIAVLFRDKYLGKVQNNASGRMSFWNDVVRFHQELEALGAIEGFAASDITVEAGSDKSAIVVTDRITPVNGMSKLYMTVTVM